MQLLNPPKSGRAPATYSGRTTFRGELQRRGIRSILELADGTTVHLTGTSSTFARFRQHVEVDGVAHWDIVTNRPRWMKVSTIRELDPADASDLFRRLADVAGSHWSGSDACAHLKRIRGGKE